MPSAKEKALIYRVAQALQVAEEIPKAADVSSAMSKCLDLFPLEWWSGI